MRDRSLLLLLMIGATSLAAFFVVHAYAQTVTGTIDMAVRVIILPTAPTNLVATTTSATRVDLAWTNTASNALGFKIEEKIGVDGTYAEIDSVGSAMTSYAATTLSPSTTYYFRVRAFNNDGASGYTNEASTTTAAAPPPPPPPPSPSPSQGGGGAGGGPTSYTPPPSPPSTQTMSVTISGYAYPLSTIVVLVDGTRVTSVVADAKAQFTASVDAEVGVRSFGVYSVDTRGRRSPVFTFTLSLNSGTVAAVSGVFLAPILEIDKAIVKRGDTMHISGQTVPMSTVTIIVHSNEVVTKNVESGVDGMYAYDLNTSALAFGDHTIKTQAVFGDDTSPDSQVISFSIGTKSVAKYIEGDITHDGRVNMVDFSIFLYNWGRKSDAALAASDLNHDGKIDLKDLSILLFHWTG